MSLKEACQLLESLKTNKIFANTPGIVKVWAEACCSLASCFFEGGGLDTNMAEGLRIIRLAAESDADTQYELGFLYMSGHHGVKKDEIEGLTFYRMAAAQEHAGAIDKLGQCYEKGLGGVKPDKAEAERFYRLAIEKGSYPASVHLKNLESGKPN